MKVTGWQCASCGATVNISEPLAFRCPNSTLTDRRHVLHMVSDDSALFDAGHRESFARFETEAAWSAFAASHGMDTLQRLKLVAELDDAVKKIDGVGFAPTPFQRSQALSDEFGFAADGGVWVKDETHAVGGSQKARFLFSILLHLRVAEELGFLPVRAPLAIASCGNAALAAATLAKAADWPIDVYVPTWMSDGFGDLLDELGARVHRSERRSDDPPGDPAMLRFRDAVAAGAIPFTVQGTENALCLDGGRTIGWEIGTQMADAGAPTLDRLFVQVGGGAFAAAASAGLSDVAGPIPLFAVQAEGCAPLARAWERADGVHDPAAEWERLMTVWDDPSSLADGILDDETYDWVSVVDAMRRTGGAPIVASEPSIVEAHRLAHQAGFDASPTGTAGLAGALTVRAEFAPSERIALVMSGVTR